MKTISIISFCLLITVVVYAQEKTDSVATERFSLLLRGGINATTLTTNFSHPSTTMNRTNEFYELDCAYPNNSLIKGSIGVAYHHLSCYTYYYSASFTRIDDFKMLQIIPHLIITTNENKRVFLRFYAGPEIGFILNEDATVYNSNNSNIQSNLLYRGAAFFLSFGTDINYLFNKYIAIGLGASITGQINQFTIYSYNAGGLDEESISFTSLSVNMLYKFN